MKAFGKVHKYGDNVDTDVIIPARYLNTADHKELAAHCMEDIDADFVKNVKEGDIIVANQNFGCGSSREHAPIAIKASGISCVIASTLQEFFTAMQLILLFLFLNVMKQLRILKR
jgi:3-isopropylmalate/(R)-2-methylmalate dehydratase small subunit